MLFENLPYTVQTLTIHGRLLEDEVRVLSNSLKNLDHISSLFLYSEITCKGVEVLAKALASRNLHTLVLTVSKLDNIIPLSQLPGLIHLQVISKDDSDAKNIASTTIMLVTLIQSLTELKTFELGIEYSSNTKSYNTLHTQGLSQIFAMEQLQHVYIQTFFDVIQWRMFRSTRKRSGIVTIANVPGPKLISRVHLGSANYRGITIFNHIYTSVTML